jgi:hypothetical protein
MKTKFHLAKRPATRHAPSSPFLSPQAVALVDERYLGWLAGQHGATHGLVRSHLMPVLADLMRQGSSDLQLQRTYLFTERLDPVLVDDVIVRAVPAHAADAGLGLVRSMGLELTQLAQHGGCGAVLVVSDDERLIPYIDEAQWRGLKVMLVTDGAALDMVKLMAEDPSWARLLMQADRRLHLGDAAWAVLTTEGAELPASRFAQVGHAALASPREGESQGEGYFHAAPPSGDWREQVQEVIRAWWAEETPHARLDLYDEMQNSQGVPPETDRHLLLRVRRELARTLSFQEKKTMREMIRSTVLAEPPTVGLADEH